MTVNSSANSVILILFAFSDNLSAENSSYLRSSATTKTTFLDVWTNPIPNKYSVHTCDAGRWNGAYILIIQGVFFTGYPPKKLKYGKPRLGESTLT